ncbi:MAG TPA: MraY family glycosyltransferase [Cyclobacteriaceae bacterium]|nr:MraY family glycosyltransferase [Cyclobacteriaceae bacterium]
MAIQLATVITSFVIAFLTIPVIIKYSLQKNLVDIPGRRKIHKKVTPSMGGIAIFLGFFVASLVWIEILSWKEIKFVMASLFVIFFIGVRDDLVPLRAIIKLMGQILVALMIIILLDLRLKSFYGLFGIEELSTGVSYLVTLLTIIVITNSFNLIDGLDGLAGSIASVSLLAFGIWFYLVGDQIYSILSFAMLGGILAFLIFNWDPSEIFMGDTGALVIGMLLSILTIHFIEFNHNLSDLDSYKFASSIAAAACFIIIPLIDTCRIIILRISKRQSPFAPDKSHIHHAIMRLGKTHAQTTVILVCIHILFIALAVLFKDLSDGYLLTGIILLSIIFSVVLDRLILSKLASKEEI